MSAHDGHRQRMRERFLSEGLDGFNEHQVLEMMLFYCIARKDTNELAHRLLREFGSLSRVLEAPVCDLEKVEGVGRNVATFLSFNAAVSRYYRSNRVKQYKVARGLDECSKILEPCFDGRRNEVVFMLCMDAKCQVLGCKQVGDGSINSAGVPVRRIVEIALSTNATSVVLAHNHPSGMAVPSPDDIQTTELLSDALRAVDVYLLDHMIFSDDEHVSMTQSGYFRPKVKLVDLQ